MKIAVAEKEEAGVVTAAMGERDAVEVMVAVEGVGVVEVMVDIAAAAVGEEVAVEVMVGAEGMVIVEVVLEMELVAGDMVDGASGTRHPHTKGPSLDFARECVCSHYLLFPGNRTFAYKVKNKSLPSSAGC